jgi:protein SCO1/2
MHCERALAFLSVALLASGCATSHKARGLVLSVDRAASRVTVSHEAIPGFMDAMVMPFSVRDRSSLAPLRPGDRIGFRIRVKGSATTIDRLRLLSAAPADAWLTMSPAAPALVGIGEVVPDFALIDHRRETLALSQLRGSIAVITFIYSRCPLPDYCPRMLANLRAVRDRFGDRVGRELSLLAVSFDPRYDTPEVLRRYARHFDADAPGWHFLTGSADDVERVCRAFGIQYWPDQGLITHTLQTVVIDRDGRLAATVEGKDVSGRQLADLVGSVLAR